MPREAVADCSHQGSCDDDVAYWAPLIARPESATPETLAACLKGYGAWDAEELADNEANWRRLVWIAAGDISEQMHEASKTTSDDPRLVTTEGDGDCD